MLGNTAPLTMKQYHHKQNSLLVSQLANLMSVTGYICTLENYQQKEENIHTFFFGGGGGGGGSLTSILPPPRQSQKLHIHPRLHSRRHAQSLFISCKLGLGSPGNMQVTLWHLGRRDRQVFSLKN